MSYLYPHKIGEQFSNWNTNENMRNEYFYTPHVEGNLMSMKILNVYILCPRNSTPGDIF